MCIHVHVGMASTNGSPLNTSTCISGKFPSVSYT